MTTPGVRIIEIDPAMMLQLGRAIAAGHTVLRCGECGGPEVCSKVQPISKCFRCGAVRKLQQSMPAPRRWRCNRCRRLYSAVFGSAICPDCRDSETRQKDRDGQRTRQQRRRAASHEAKTGPTDARNH